MGRTTNNPNPLRCLWLGGGAGRRGGGGRATRHPSARLGGGGGGRGEGGGRAAGGPGALPLSAPSKNACQVIIGTKVQFVYDELKKML